MEKATKLAQQGELSHAAKMLSALDLAPGTSATLEELRNPTLRPSDPSEPFPEELPTFRPASQLQLDRDVFGTVLRQTRKGLLAGLWGARYEHFKLCLEDDTAFEMLRNIAERMATADIPESIRDAFHLSSITALTKPNNRIRGISAGDAFRRLVAKTLAKQFQE